MTKEISREDELNAQRLFRFMSMYDHPSELGNYTLNNGPTRFPIIVAMGGWDLRVAERAAKLFEEGMGDYIITTGKNGRNTEGFEQPEAYILRDIAIKNGVPKERILCDAESTNTGQNVQYTRKLLEERGINAHEGIFVHMKTSLLRDHQVILKQGGGIKPVMAGPNVNFDNYEGNLISRREMIEDMVGDVHRLWAHAPHFLDTPAHSYNIVDSFRYLVERGYGDHLVKNDGVPVNLPYKTH